MRYFIQRPTRASSTARCLVAVVAIAASCSAPPAAPPAPVSQSRPAPAQPADDEIVISIVGTNDVHGALDRLPVLGGYVANLRAARARDGGAVLLIDAGDMFQGTIESNSNEGAAVIDAYNALGYTAATVGNHEFDFGPVGEAPIPEQPGDDPRGALKARIQQARFPLLSANVVDAATGAHAALAGSPASVLHRAAGVEVGIIGVTTHETLRTTMAANVAGLAIAPLADTIAGEARALRRRGAGLVVVTAHAGGHCEDFSEPGDLSSCRDDDEIMAVARALPTGAVDVIVAGHTHLGMAHRVNGIAIIESYHGARAFGRVDVTFDRASGKVASARIFPPRDLCQGGKPASVAECRPGAYAGRPVTPDPAVLAVVTPALERAEVLRKAPLGVDIVAPVTRAYGEESPLGNLFADLMRAAVPADVAITNGGGLRANLPAGPLTYGSLYQAMPFDNRFATIEMRGVHLAAMLASNLAQRNGILLLSGARASARCKDGAIEVTLTRDDGKPIANGDVVTIVTSDFLASGGDNFSRLGLTEDAVKLHDGPVIRDGMAAVLRKRGGAISGDDPRIFNPRRPRLDYPRPRPVRCPPP